MIKSCMTGDEESPPPNEYEQQRLRNIARNKAHLATLDVHSLAQRIFAHKKVPRSRKNVTKPTGPPKRNAPRAARPSAIQLIEMSTTDNQPDDVEGWIKWLHTDKEMRNLKDDVIVKLREAFQSLADNMWTPKRMKKLKEEERRQEAVKIFQASLRQAGFSEAHFLFVALTELLESIWKHTG